MSAAAADPRREFLDALAAVVHSASLTKLTLGKHRGEDASLKNLFVTPVVLKDGPRLKLVWRHATRDVTKNLPAAEGLALIGSLIGRDFLDAHLFTPTETLQLECKA